MTALYLYDDRVARGFAPFALTRPVGELRAGAELVRRRWERALGEAAHGFIGAAHLADFEEFDAPAAATATLPVGAIVANARAVVALVAGPRDATVWRCDGRVAAVRLAEPAPLSRFAGGELTLDALAADASRRAGAREHADLSGRWLDHVWDLIGQLDAQLRDDLVALAPTVVRAPSHAGTVLGAHDVVIEAGATIEPFVVLDASVGPILVRSGATVQSFTRIVGPCYIGAGSTVVADRISGCSIGDTCKIHGEISTSVVLGHSNKGHDGFVGHSYFGRWVNLGAGTTTSNLKNTYGTVALWTPDGVRDTGLQFLGTLFGDHAKTGIGLRLTTGTVVGAGANVYDAMPPKVVEPFAWGGSAPYGRFDGEKFLDVAERVMRRRNVALGERGRAQLRAAMSGGAAPDGGGRGA